jgi:hypothetical protein
MRISTVGNCLKIGFEKLGERKRLVLPFYLANLFLGLLAILPAALLLDSYVGNSMMRARFDTGVEWSLLLEFILEKGDALGSVSGLAIAAPIVYWVVALFLSGGAMALFAEDAKYAPELFWGRSARYFGRYLRLALMSIPVLAALFSLRFLADLFQWIFTGGDAYSYTSYWMGWVKTGFGYVGLLLFCLLFDYARIDVVVNGETKVRKSLWRAVKLIWANPRKTVGLALFLAVIGALGFGVFYLLFVAFKGSNALILVSLFVFQQLYVLWRMVLRLVGYSSQLELYSKLCPRN